MFKMFWNTPPVTNGKHEMSIGLILQFHLGLDKLDSDDKAKTSEGSNDNTEDLDNETIA